MRIILGRWVEYYLVMDPGTRVLEVPWTNGFERNLGEKIFVLFFSLKKWKFSGESYVQPIFRVDSGYSEPSLSKVPKFYINDATCSLF